MMRIITVRQSISFQVSRPFLVPRVSVLAPRVPALPSRILADPVRPFTTAAPVPDHRLLRSLSR